MDSKLGSGVRLFIAGVELVPISLTKLQCCTVSLALSLAFWPASACLADDVRASGSGTVDDVKKPALIAAGSPFQTPAAKPSGFLNSPQFGNQPGSAPSNNPALRGPIKFTPGRKSSAVKSLRVELNENPGPSAASGSEEFDYMGQPVNGPNSLNDVADGAGPITARQALSEALLKSPKIAATRALLGISKALYASAYQLPNPVFFRDEGAIAEGVRRVGPTITYNLPWKLAFRLIAAKQQVKETKLEILNTLWQFRNDVRRAFVEVMVAQETYQAQVDIADLANRLLQVSAKRFQSGAVPELDVLKARLAASQAGIEAARGRMRIMHARQQLNVILGRTFNSPISVARLPSFEAKDQRSELLPDYNLPVPPVTEFISEALANRLELKINDQQIKLTRAQLNTSYGNVIPDPQIGYGSSTNINLPSGPKLNGVFATLNFELPVFTYQQGDIARLKATLKQFQLQDAAIRNQINADVTSAYNNLITARNRLRTYQQHVLADSAEVARLARRSYEVGQSDISDTLIAQQQNIQVRKDYLDAVSNYQQAYTDLEQSIGEPIE